MGMAALTCPDRLGLLDRLDDAGWRQGSRLPASQRRGLPVLLLAVGGSCGDSIDIRITTPMTNGWQTKLTHNGQSFLSLFSPAAVGVGDVVVDRRARAAIFRRPPSLAAVPFRGR